MHEKSVKVQKSANVQKINESAKILKSTKMEDRKAGKSPQKLYYFELLQFICKE